MRNPTTAISIVAFSELDQLLAVQKQYDELGGGRTARYELSYGLSAAAMETLLDLIVGRVVSVHAACPKTRYFPNLASANARVVDQSMLDLMVSLDTAVRFGADIMVMHPGYATDNPVPSEMLPRAALLAGEEFHPHIWKKKGSISFPTYVHQQSYRGFAQRAMENLLVLIHESEGSGVRLAVENLNPRAGYLFQTPSEMVEIANVHPNMSLCLDIGHLWASSCVYAFDFLEGLQCIVATGNVITSHLHNNFSSPPLVLGDPDSGVFEDSHVSLDRGNLPYVAAVRILAEAGVNLVLEVKEEPLHNMMVLQDIVQSSVNGIKVGGCK